jgi:hypothetical protein
VHSAHRRALGRCGHLAHIHQFDVEDQVGLGWNSRMGGVWPRTAFGPVRQLPGDEDAALAVNLHAFIALIKAGNDAAHTLWKRHGLGNIKFWFAIVAHHRLAVFVLQRLPVVV